MSAAYPVPMAPPQESPVAQVQGKEDPTTLFSILWYKFFDSVQRKLTDLQNQIDSLTPGTVTSQVEYFTMTANTNITSPSTPNEGDLLTVYVAQDATGGWVATFDPVFKMVTSDDVDPIPLKTTILQFIGVTGNKWWLNAPPFSRDTP